MSRFVILSSSVRTNRNSHRVALFFEQFIASEKLGDCIILDLMEYRFPLFEERLRLQKDPAPATLDFAEKIKNAEGIIMVTPEYNGGYPASLKNAIDLLYDEWYRKPVAFATVSEGAFGGTQVITSLQFSLWKMKAWTVAAHFPVPKVTTAFDEKGNALDKDATEKRARSFISELNWCMAAKRGMESK